MQDEDDEDADWRDADGGAEDEDGDYADQDEDFPPEEDVGFPYETRTGEQVDGARQQEQLPGVIPEQTKQDSRRE